MNRTLFVAVGIGLLAFAPGLPSAEAEGRGCVLSFMGKQCATPKPKPVRKGAPLEFYNEERLGFQRVPTPKPKPTPKRSTRSFAPENGSVFGASPPIPTRRGTAAPSRRAPPA